MNIIDSHFFHAPAFIGWQSYVVVSSLSSEDIAQSLRKVELDSTSCKKCCETSWLGVCYTNQLRPPPPPPPHIKGPRAPYKNVHVMKTMYQNSVELRPVLLLPKAIFSLWGSLAVTAVPPVSDSRRPFCNHCCRPFYIYNHCCRPFYNRRLHEVKITRIYLIISINNCLLTDMLVLESFRFD